MKDSETGKVVELSKPDDQATGDGPRFIKLGGAVRYDPSDLKEFIGTGIRTSTSDPGPRTV